MDRVPSQQQVYILGGARTPFQRSATDYRGVRNVELGASCLKHVFETVPVQVPYRLRVLASTVNRPETSNLARDAAVRAALDVTVSDLTVSAGGASGAHARVIVKSGVSA